LARSRFTVSPLSETVAALTALSRPDPPGLPWERAFRAPHREAYVRMLAEDEARAALADRLWRPRRGDRPGWMAGFLTLPPLGGDASFEDELAQLDSWDDNRIREEARQLTAGPLPRVAVESGCLARRRQARIETLASAV
ncbi:MAG TPA: hypothetical protein VF060_19055, partial [Trebonia sp.]